MARVLVHYDIPDEDCRTKFQHAITREGFSPVFAEQTKSVYAANIDLLPKNISKLTASLRALLGKAPAGTKVFLERPDSTCDRPDIIQEKIV